MARVWFLCTNECGGLAVEKQGNDGLVGHHLFFILGLTRREIVSWSARRSHRELAAWWLCIERWV
jgi:hypothetical protein